jgi:Domain of unknown function (DUF1905)
MLDKTFTATIVKDTVNSGWTCVIWSESATVFGTRKPVKVSGTVDGHDFQATFLPFGDGTHMLPLKAALMKTLKKQVGDTVEVHLTERR